MIQSFMSLIQKFLWQSYLHPCKEHSNSNGVVESCLPVTEELKVGVLVWVTDELAEFVVYFYCPIYVKRDTQQGNDDHSQIQNVPQTLEVWQLVFLDLKNILKL